MLITSPCVVSLTWRLEDAHGQLIDDLDIPVEFLLGGDDLLAKVEEVLLGQTAGFHTELQLEPEQAFGEYDADLVFFEARSLFPPELEAGMQFDGPPPGAVTEGLDPDAFYTVTEVYPEHVVLDGNHPLAGIALRLDLTVRDVRAATEEEIEARTVNAAALSVASGAPPSQSLH